MRVSMVQVLLGKPDILLMDEPTNHLDIESILWLERFLKDARCTLLITSHDRDFMNRVVERIVEIDGGEVYLYKGNYDFYERERANFFRGARSHHALEPLREFAHALDVFRRAAAAGLYVLDGETQHERRKQ